MFSLKVITVDRFYAVVFPMRARVQNIRTRVKLLICSWLIPTAMFSPMLFFKYKDCYRRMNKEQQLIHFSTSVSLLFLLPLLIMVVLNSMIIVQLR